MGGLPALAAWLAALALVATVAGCQNGGADKPAVVRERSDIVVATARQSSEPPPRASASAAPKRRGKLCADGSAARRLPDKEAAIEVARAAGARALPNPIPFGQGRWIWVNLWAAWCKPCIAEMPRLLRWQAALRKAGVPIDLAFVSLDDDERQLQRFLDGQAASGVRQSYWLRGEEQRETWLGPLGIKPDARLPVQVLVSPQGQVACFIDGGVEEGDYPSIARVLGVRGP